MTDLAENVNINSAVNVSPLHNQARALAEGGVKVFPIRAGTKFPATAHGFKDATTNRAQIDAWWAENPDFNIGVCPADAGWSVVDLDPDSEKGWLALLAKHCRLPETYEVATPRGGRHIYFIGSLPPSASKLAPHVDTRGQDSYVLVPPSVVNGKRYSVLHDRELAPLPTWIGEALKVETIAVKAAPPIELDTKDNILRAQKRIDDLIARGDVAIEGCGGDNRTYKLFAELHNLGISPNKSIELVETWNAACVPPWSPDELATLAWNASSYAQNAAGVWAVGSAADTFRDAPALRELLKAPAPSNDDRLARYFHAEDEDEQDVGGDQKWLLPGVLPDEDTVLLFAPSQSYKSFVALDWALALATGAETCRMKPERTGVAVYAPLEGAPNIKRPRRRAWRLAHGITGKIKNFFVLPAPLVGDTVQKEKFCDELRRLRARLGPLAIIVIDTAAKAMAGLDENSVKDTGILSNFCDGLVAEFGCAVVAVHHTGKDESRGARGSSAFLGNFASRLRIEADRNTKTAELWVEKHKDAEEATRPWTFKMVTHGPSIVPYWTTTDEHREAAPPTGKNFPQAIGKALAALREMNGGDDRLDYSTQDVAVKIVDLGHSTLSVATVAKHLQEHVKNQDRRVLAYVSDPEAKYIRWGLPPKAKTEENGD